MKNSVVKSIQFLFSNPKFFLKFKDIAMTNPAEHLYRTVQYIKKEGYVTDDHCIVDIGAANGGTCLFFSKHFPDLKVVGFEPNKAVYEAACRKTAGYPNISLFNLALSARAGEGQLHVMSDTWSSSLNPISAGEKSQVFAFHEVAVQPVKLSTLDEIYPRSSNTLLIKIDTQGTELSIFKGATETLKKTKLILTELNNHPIYDNTCQYFEVDSFLRAHHFKLKDIFVIYRANGLKEFDALYENTTL